MQSVLVSPRYDKEEVDADFWNYPHVSPLSFAWLVAVMSDSDSNEPGWWIYLVYLGTLAPWAFIQFFDAIDEKKREVIGLPWRLGLSFLCNLASSGVGLWYVVWAFNRSRTESATMLIGVVLNSWYWKRNLRGWRSYGVLVSQKRHVCHLLASLMKMRMRGMPTNRGEYSGDVENGTGRHLNPQHWEGVWCFLWVNDKVIDNDPREDNVSLASGSW